MTIWLEEYWNQRKEIDELTQQAKDKLAKILTPEQMKTLNDSRPPRPSN